MFAEFFDRIGVPDLENLSANHIQTPAVTPAAMNSA